MDSEQINLLISLKGAPSSILWALAFHGELMDRNHLVLATGYTRNTVTKGLKILEALRLVERAGRFEGWCLTSLINQFELPGLVDEGYSEDGEENEPYYDEEENLELVELQPDMTTGPVKVKNSPSRNEDHPEKVNNSPSQIDEPNPKVKNLPSGIADHPTKVKISPSQIDEPDPKVKNSPSRNEDHPTKVNISPSQIDEPNPKVKNSPSRTENDQAKVKISPSPLNSFSSTSEIYPPESKTINVGQRISTEEEKESGMLRAENPSSSDNPTHRTVSTGNTPVPGLPGPAGQFSPVALPGPPSIRSLSASLRPDPAGLSLTDGLDPRLLRAFRSAGLLLTPRTRALALRPHVTPRYVRAHHAQLKADGKATATGLLVTILEAGLPAPETNPNGHLTTCTCDECSYKYRYKLP